MIDLLIFNGADKDATDSVSLFVYDCHCTSINCLYIYMFRPIWEFAQSADCVAQTEDPQIACQSADLLEFFY